MSSGQHTPRRAPSLRDASRRDLLTVLGNDRQRTADVRPVPYVARIGRDKHLVRNPGSGVVYSVGGPAQSFKPGTTVFLGSHTGHPGESIIALPAPGQRGTSGFPESKIGGELKFPVPDEPPADCPPVQGILGRQYVGANYGPVDGNLSAFAYSDKTVTGTIAEIINPYDSAREFVLFGKDGGTEYLVGTGNLPHPDNSTEIFSWNLSANTLHPVKTGVFDEVDRIAGPVLVGTTIYFAVESSDGHTITLYSAELGETNAAPSPIGSLNDADIDWTFASLAHVGSGKLYVEGDDNTQPAGSQDLWSDILGGVKVVTRFNEEDIKSAGATGLREGWVPWGQRSISNAYFSDELWAVASGGTHSLIIDASVNFPGLNWSGFNRYHGWTLNQAQTEIAFYHTTEGIFRIILKSYAGLEACSVEATGIVDDMPGLGFTPDFFFCRD